MQVSCPLWDTFSLCGVTQQTHKLEAAPWTPGKQGLELSLSPLDSQQEEGQEYLQQNKGLSSQVNWRLGMVSCVSNSGQFLLDSSPYVNFIIPVVGTKTSHSGDENCGDRG